MENKMTLPPYPNLPEDFNRWELVLSWHGDGNLRYHYVLSRDGTFWMGPFELDAIPHGATAIIASLYPESVKPEHSESLYGRVDRAFEASKDNPLIFINDEMEEVKQAAQKQDSGLSNYDPKGEAGAKKTPLQLLPSPALAAVARSLAFGAYKAGPNGTGYGPWNWRENRVEMMTYVGAIRRHLDAFIERDDIDESGEHHIAHVAASCMILLDAMHCGTLIDNRPPAARNSELKLQKEQCKTH